MYKVVVHVLQPTGLRYSNVISLLHRAVLTCMGCLLVKAFLETLSKLPPETRRKEAREKSSKDTVDTQYNGGVYGLVPGPWPLAPGPWPLVPGPWSLVPGTWHLAPGPWHLAPGTCLVVGVWRVYLGQWSVGIGDLG